MLVARFGQADTTGIDIGTEANPIRITPSGSFPPETQSDLGPGIDVNQVIDVAPSQNQEPAPIRLPPLVVTAPAPSAPAASPAGGSPSLSTGQTLVLLGVGAAAAAAILYLALTATPVTERVGRRGI